MVTRLQLESLEAGNTYKVHSLDSNIKDGVFVGYEIDESDYAATKVIFSHRTYSVGEILSIE